MAIKAQQSYIEVMRNGSLVEIEEVNNITGPSGKAKLIDTTHLRSSGKETLAGIPDWGEITLDCNFIGGTNQMYLRTMYATQASAVLFRIRVPDGTSYHVFDFDAIVSSWNIDLKTDDKAGLKVTLNVSGGLTYTAPHESGLYD